MGDEQGTQGLKGGTFVLFRLAEEQYGLPIEKVSSIIRYEQATPVPRSPESVQGVINLRGRVIPVVDLTRRLFRRPFEPSATSRIVVAEGDAGTVGLAVDAANEVVTIGDEDVRPAPDSVLSEETAEAFVGVAEHGEALVILLDLDQAVPSRSYMQARAASEAGEAGSDV